MFSAVARWDDACARIVIVATFFMRCADIHMRCADMWRATPCAPNLEGYPPSASVGPATGLIFDLGRMETCYCSQLCTAVTESWQQSR